MQGVQPGCPSIVRAAGLSELVCANLDAYEARAVELALDAAQRTRIKTQLQTAGASSALWDGADLARCLERAFEMMGRATDRGLPPAPLQVPPA
jgi:predicted O-linked N-acetylglucosamine transferase (SPINDLY family)